MIPKAKYEERAVFTFKGEALDKALANHAVFQGMSGDLLSAMRAFKTNPEIRDAEGKAHNPQGSLSGFLWKLQDAIQPDRKTPEPLLELCPRTRKLHLKRGLTLYCSEMLKAMQGIKEEVVP